jgi:TRAP-type mannitol/chloroaromatic compound transport system permease small subunit
MDQEILEKIKEQDAKLDAIYASVEKTRKYLIWKTIISVIFFVLPLVGLAFLIPWFLKTITAAYSGLLN